MKPLTDKGFFNNSSCIWMIPQVDGVWTTMAAGYPLMASSGTRTTYTVRLPKVDDAFIYNSHTHLVFSCPCLQGTGLLYDPTITATSQVVVVNAAHTHSSLSWMAWMVAFMMSYKIGLDGHWGAL